MRFKTENIDIEIATYGAFLGLKTKALTFEMMRDFTGQGLSARNWVWHRKVEQEAD